MGNLKLKMFKEEPVVQTRSTKLYQISQEIENRWKTDPIHYSVTKNIFVKERFLRLKSFVEKERIQGKKILDLGCATGDFSRYLRDIGAHVTAVDGSVEALKRFGQKDCSNILLKHELLPFTKLQDKAFDHLFLLDVIAEIPNKQRRLTISELSRLVKDDGVVYVSTELDIYSEGALEAFLAIFQTEFHLEKMQLSSHKIALLLKALLDKPDIYLELIKEESRLKKLLKQKKGLLKFLLKIQTKKPLFFLWSFLKLLFKPLKKILEKRSVCLFLEKLSFILWQERSYSHVIVQGRKKNLIDDRCSHHIR